MSSNAFLNNTVEINGNPNDSVICGKIVLETKKWEISYVCDFCGKSLSTLPELLGHALSHHIKDVPDKKFCELFGIAIKHDDDLEHEAEAEFLQEIFNSRKQQEVNARYISDTQQHVNDVTVEDVDNDTDSLKNENPMGSNKIVATMSNANVELPSVSEKDENVEKNPRQKCINTNPVICDKCNRKFPNLRRLKLHQEYYCDQLNICTECGAIFKDRYSLKIHYKRHKGIKPYACEVCQKAFTTMTEFNLHKRHHTGERPFECAECDKRFVTSSGLSRHQRRHTNELPYLCQTCGRAFSSSTLLGNHIPTHSTEKPHKCTKCNAKFSNPKGLRQHMQIHADVKKYSCKLCGKSFAQPAGIYSHMRRMHKNEITS